MFWVPGLLHDSVKAVSRTNHYWSGDEHMMWDCPGGPKGGRHIPWLRERFPCLPVMWTKEHFAELLLVVVLCPWRKWLMDKTDMLKMTEWRDSYKMDLGQYHWTTASWVSTAYTFHHKNYGLNISLKIFVLKFNYIKAMVVKKS